MSEQVFLVRQRRIVSAIMRGFATIAFWTAFGIALNSLLLVFPTLHWVDVAPVGLLFAAIALLSGWVMDGVERLLRPLNPPPRVDLSEQGDRWSTLIVVLPCAGAGISVLDTRLPVTFQSVLLFTVPAYARLWIIWLYGRVGPATLSGEFIGRAPSWHRSIRRYSSKYCKTSACVCFVYCKSQTFSGNIVTK